MLLLAGVGCLYTQYISLVCGLNTQLPVRPPLVAFIRLLGPHLSAARSAVSRLLTEAPPSRGYQMLSPGAAAACRP
jgi:hypothetical protein